MNRYLFLHRITGPVILLVFGVTALLDTWHVLSYGESWPLYLIAIGLLQLAKRAAWAQMQAPPPVGYPGGSGTGAGNYPGSYQGSYQGPPQGPYPSPSQDPSQAPPDSPEERRAGWDAARGMDGEEGGGK